MKSTQRLDRVEISALVFQEEGCWIAQCVEYDIVVHASEPAALPKAIEKAVLMNVCVNAELGRTGLEGVPAAPDHFREIFDRATMDLKLRGKPDRNSKGGRQVKIRSMRLVTAMAA